MARNAWKIPLLLLVPVVALVPAEAASARGGPSSCTTTTFYSHPLLTKPTTFAAENAGSVTLTPDRAGVKVVKAVGQSGWYATVETSVGPSVGVQFQNGKLRKKFKAAGTAGYYGYLQVEVDTCT